MDVQPECDCFAGGTVIANTECHQNPEQSRGNLQIPSRQKSSLPRFPDTFLERIVRDAYNAPLPVEQIQGLPHCQDPRQGVVFVTDSAFSFNGSINDSIKTRWHGSKTDTS